ncbi:hypothetical protein NLG97_g7485 [Lecanicillium saksenae]|uniref:Uncharacterized protein n=1 Tax=Lecanicillium saksenae TaxID=468837 RepID=A0ACC1QN89_9HYPO|nr:hypothetical protein NLG97_g7485 [Lecanicillium saksenae]
MFGQAARAAKMMERLKLQAKASEEEKNRLDRAKIDPFQMFKNTDEDLEWDESGIPVLDATGAALSKNRRKKLAKEWERQKVSKYPPEEAGMHALVPAQVRLYEGVARLNKCWAARHHLQAVDEQMHENNVALRPAWVRQRPGAPAACSRQNVQDIV